MLTPQERDAFRKLVESYLRLAEQSNRNEKIELWKCLNRGQMVRPMVVIDQLPWNELSCEELTPTISDPYWREVELEYRRKIYQFQHFPVDMVLEPFLSAPKILQHTGYGLTAETVWLGTEDSTAKSQHYSNLITSMEDVEKITPYRITEEKEQTELRRQEAECLFGDLAPTIFTGHTFHLGLWDYVSQLMGVEEIYYALVDDPDRMHAVMNQLTNATIQAIRDANQYGAHNDQANTCHCSYIYTDQLLANSGKGKGPFSQNSWAFGMAQLFTSVSPDIFEEFELPYISRMAEEFGMIYYGCCDRLDDRLDLVKKIPHVRKVSCSPWSNREQFAEKIGTELVMSSKPSPAFLAAESFDEDIVRKDLEYTCRLARENHVNLEFILKDISTVHQDPRRLEQWAQIAMEVVEGF